MANVIEGGRVYQNGFTVEPVAIEEEPIIDQKLFNLSDHDNQWLQMELKNGLEGRSYSWYQFGHQLSQNEYCIEVAIEPSLIENGELPVELLNHYHRSGFNASNPQIEDYMGIKVAKATLSRSC